MPKGSKKNQELIILLIVLGLIFLGLTLVKLPDTKTIKPETLSLAGGLILLFLLFYLAIRWLLPASDPLLIPLTALLCGLGLTMIYRIKPELVASQVLWISLGITAAITVCWLFKRYQILQNYKYLSATTGLILLLAPATQLGYERYGAKLWLRLGAFSFQPSEIAKILIIIFLAAYLNEKRELLATATRRIFGMWIPHLKYFGPLITMWLISLLILIYEKDLGSSLLFFGVFLAMIYISTQRLIYAISGSALFLSGAYLCYQVYGHVQTRVNIWLNPWIDPAGQGYQITQSLFAIASGGLTGTGLSLGFPTKIPAVHTDFVFSAACEELGLIGGVGIIIAYLLFTYRGFKIALSVDDGFGKMLAAGLTTAFGLQSFVIIGGVTKLIPLTGVTLPFMSYGGSSILSNFILVGLLLIISHSASPSAYKDLGREEARR